MGTLPSSNAAQFTSAPGIEGGSNTPTIFWSRHSGRSRLARNTALNQRIAKRQLRRAPIGHGETPGIAPCGAHKRARQRPHVTPASLKRIDAQFLYGLARTSGAVAVGGSGLPKVIRTG